MKIEHELRRALRRERPPEGFAARVTAAAKAEERERRGPVRGWRAVAASIALIATVGGWAAYREHERQEGIRARDQVLLALHIAGEKVRYAQHEVRDIGESS